MCCAKALSPSSAMMTASVAFFVYGVFGGGVFTLLFLIVAFRRAEQAISAVVRKKALKHAQLIAVAQAAAAVPQAKVEALCKVVRFDNNIVGEAVRVRAVLHNQTVTLYQVEELEKLPNHTQQVRAERLLGKINVNAVEASSYRISKYQRHMNTGTRYAPVKGKCTVLTAKGGPHVFVEDPAAKLKENLERSKQERTQLTKDLRRRVDAFAEHCLAPAKHPPSEACDTESLFLAKQRFLAAPSPEAAGAKAGRIPRRATFVGMEAIDSLMQARCIAIKFSNRRENERWLNLMQSTEQTSQWRDFIHHLPQVDVLNLLTARLFFENTRTSDLNDLLKTKLQAKLETVSKSLPPHITGTISLDALAVGGEVPLLSNVSDANVSPSGDVEFDFDILYRGGLAISIRFAIHYRKIRVPDIIFHVKLLELAGRMRFRIAPPPTDKFWLAVPKPPQLRLDFTQEVASHDGFLNAFMSIIPDMSKVMSNIVRVMLFDDMLLPSYDDFPWPVIGKEDEKESTEEEVDDADTASVSPHPSQPLRRRVSLPRHSLPTAARSNLSSTAVKKSIGGRGGISPDVSATPHRQKQLPRGGKRSSDDGVKTVISIDRREVLHSSECVPGHGTTPGSRKDHSQRQEGSWRSSGVGCHAPNRVRGPGRVQSSTSSSSLQMATAPPTVVHRIPRLRQSNDLQAKRDCPKPPQQYDHQHSGSRKSEEPTSASVSLHSV